MKFRLTIIAELRLKKGKSPHKEYVGCECQVVISCTMNKEQPRWEVGDCAIEEVEMTYLSTSVSFLRQLEA